MRIDVISIFPELFDTLNQGVIARAIKEKIIELNLWNPRSHANNAHGYIDDKPYGGGPGMVMSYEPLYLTLEEIKNKTTNLTRKIVCLTPSGQTFNQSQIKKNLQLEQLIFICGRYEGIDQRFIDHCVDETWSLGNFVLSGGELAACCMIDAITRQLPGTLGNAESLTCESFNDDQCDFPVYTRPASIHGHDVPKELLQGDHKAIEAWRQKNRIIKED